MSYTTAGDFIRTQRLAVYKRLIERYGWERVVRHARRIAASLDTLEAQTYAQGREKL